MEINLNEESYDGGNSVAIFNGGVPGIVENVVLTISKKTAEDKETAPDYKLTFTGENDAHCNTALWYITKNTEYNTIAEQQVKQGKILKHVAHAVLGDSYQFPPFADAKAMLDGVMKLIKEGLTNSGKFRIFANYGAKISPKQYVQPRSWVPFMESMTVALEDTRLSITDIDCMERLTADAPITSTATTDEW